MKANKETSENKENKQALIIGGSRGIGKATALQLARSGFNILLTYHKNHEAAQTVCEEIMKTGQECETISFDVASTEETTKALRDRLDERVPDVVVFNSGIAKDNIFVLEFRLPTEEDENGFHQATNSDVLTGIYACIQVDSKFSEGMFTQTLTAYKDYNTAIDLAKLK